MASGYLGNITPLLTNMYLDIGNKVYTFYVDYSRMILDYFHIIFKSTFNTLIFVATLISIAYLIMSVYVYLSKKSRINIPEQDYTPTVTVQIPTFNELAALACAKKCSEFDYPKDKLQIIIGDDSNKKEVSEKIDSFAKKINKKHPGLILVTRRGLNVGFKPGNLNHMLKFTKGEYIVIFDSDFSPEKDFLRRVIAPFKENKNLSVVQARWKIVNFDQNIISMLGGSISVLFHHVVLPFVRKFDGSTMLCGSAEAIRKKDLIAAGGWLAGSLTEDVECTMRLLKKGKKIIYLEDVECECEVPHTAKDLFKQQKRWAYGVISALKKHLLSLLKSKSVRARDKVAVILFSVMGYAFSVLLVLITIFGLLSMISDTPGPINWTLFFGQLGINILFTSGVLIATTVSLLMSKNIRKLPQIVIASFTIGLAMTFFVSIGMTMALLGRPMQWFMLKKNANTLKA